LGFDQIFRPGNAQRKYRNTHKYSDISIAFPVTKSFAQILKKEFSVVPVWFAESKLLCDIDF